MEGKEEKGWRGKEGGKGERRGGGGKGREREEVVGEGGIKRKMDHLRTCL